jgi:hypothetical protein
VKEQSQIEFIVYWLNSISATGYTRTSLKNNQACGYTRTSLKNNQSCKSKRLNYHAQKIGNWISTRKRGDYEKGRESLACKTGHQQALQKNCCLYDIVDAIRMGLSLQSAIQYVSHFQKSKQLQIRHFMYCANYSDRIYFHIHVSVIIYSNLSIHLIYKMYMSIPHNKLNSHVNYIQTLTWNILTNISCQFTWYNIMYQGCLICVGGCGCVGVTVTALSVVSLIHYTSHIKEEYNFKHY